MGTCCPKKKILQGKKIAHAGNRTRVSRVAGENYTPKPRVLMCLGLPILFLNNQIQILKTAQLIFMCGWVFFTKKKLYIIITISN